MASSKRIPGQKKLSGGATLYNDRVKLSGSFDNSSLENVTTLECNKCGLKKELREEIPNRAKRDAFQLEAKTHNCEAKTRTQEFLTAAAKEYEMGRRDLNG